MYVNVSPFLSTCTSPSQWPHLESFNCLKLLHLWHNIDIPLTSAFYLSWFLTQFLPLKLYFYFIKTSASLKCLLSSYLLTFCYLPFIFSPNHLPISSTLSYGTFHCTYRWKQSWIDISHLSCLLLLLKIVVYLHGANINLRSSSSTGLMVLSRNLPMHLLSVLSSFLHNI